jgi:thymidylate synthase
MIIHKIVVRDLPDLWFQAVHDVLDVGRRFVVDRGSYAGQTRLEYDYFIGHVKQPWFGTGTKEILPDIPECIGIPNPVLLGYVYGDKDHPRSYVEYVMTAEKQPGESYTYGERLVKAPINKIMAKIPRSIYFKEIVLQDIGLWDRGIIYEENGIVYINQIELIIWTYKNKGHRNNQMVLQVAQPSDCFLQDPPCLRQIDTRIQDGKLHFIIYFRSWDLWGGLPANLAGIQALQQYMAECIEVEHGQMIVESKGLHLYGYAEDLAKMRCLKEK